jgi:hypothetical protein
MLLAFATPRRRVRIRARVRAGTTLSHQRAPQHARTPTRRRGWTFGPFFLRRASPPRFGRPRRHGLAMVGYFAHAVAGGGGVGAALFGTKCTPCHRPELPRMCALVPIADALPVATHGAGPSSAASPAATPLLRPTPSLAVSFTLRARFPAHAIARAFTRLCTGNGHQHRRRADVAAPTPATTSPRRPSPSILRPFEPSNPRGFLEVIPFWPVAQAPWSSAAGEVIPRRRFSYGHFVKHLGSLMKHGNCFVHGGPHAGVAVANPPRSAVAKPLPSRPHACMHRAEPHGIPPDLLRQPMGARPRAGLLVAKPHPIRGPRVSGSV